MGDVESVVVERIKEGIEKTYSIIVEIRDSIELPVLAFDPFRHQYRSDVLLDFLEKTRGRNVLAITEKDLYANGLNFVFGQARVKGGIAIVSVCRLRPEFYNRAPNNELLYERAVKEAVHEVGHAIFGLMHCPNDKCVMSFSNTVADVDKKTRNLCRMCKLRAGL